MPDTETPWDGPELVLTMTALERLWSLIEESGDPHCKLRIRADGPTGTPSFSLSLEENAAPGDVELDFVRIAVLLDPESHERLRGHEVDHRDGDEGEHFVIRRAG